MNIFTEVDERVERQMMQTKESVIPCDCEVCTGFRGRVCISDGCANPPHPDADGYCAPCMVKMAEEWDREFWIIEVEKGVGK